MKVFPYGIFLGLDSCTYAPVTTPFILKNDWPNTGKPALYLPPLYNPPLTAAPAGDHQGLEPFQKTELPGAFL